MALSKYVLTSTVTVPAGAATANTNGFGLVSYAQGAGEYGSAPAVTFIAGTAIVLDPAGALYAATGAGNLRAYVQSQDDVGHAALAN